MSPETLLHSVVLVIKSIVYLLSILSCGYNIPQLFYLVPLMITILLHELTVNLADLSFKGPPPQ